MRLAITNRATAIIVFVLAVVVVLYGAFYNVGGRPTCITYALASDASQARLALRGVIEENGFQEKAGSAVLLRAAGDDLFLKLDQTGGGDTSMIAFCASGKVNNSWFRIAKDVEAALLKQATIQKATLQRGTEYSCDRGCSFQPCANPCSRSLEVPVNYDVLRRSGVL